MAFRNFLRDYKGPVLMQKVGYFRYVYTDLEKKKVIAEEGPKLKYILKSPN